MGKEKPRLAERFFHPNEIKRLNDCCPDERTTLFYRYWAAKESYLKYIGTGLSGSLSSFEIFFEKESVYLADSHLKKQVHMHECQIDKNYPCIVCAETSELPDLLPFYFPE